MHDTLAVPAENDNSRRATFGMFAPLLIGAVVSVVSFPILWMITEPLLEVPPVSLWFGSNSFFPASMAISTWLGITQCRPFRTGVVLAVAFAPLTFFAYHDDHVLRTVLQFALMLTTANLTAWCVASLLGLSIVARSCSSRHRKFSSATAAIILFAAMLISISVARQTLPLSQQEVSFWDICLVQSLFLGARAGCFLTVALWTCVLLRNRLCKLAVMLSLPIAYCLIGLLHTTFEAVQWGFDFWLEIAKWEVKNASFDCLDSTVLLATFYLPLLFGVRNNDKIRILNRSEFAVANRLGIQSLIWLTVVAALIVTLLPRESLQVQELAIGNYSETLKIDDRRYVLEFTLFGKVDCVGLQRAYYAHLLENEYSDIRDDFNLQKRIHNIDQLNQMQLIRPIILQRVRELAPEIEWIGIGFQGYYVYETN